MDLQVSGRAQQGQLFKRYVRRNEFADGVAYREIESAKVINGYERFALINRSAPLMLFQRYCQTSCTRGVVENHATAHSLIFFTS